MRLSLHQLPCKPLAVEGGTGGGPSGSGAGKHSKPRRARSENWRIELETFARLLCSFTAFSARFFCVETRAWTIERTSILRESNSEVEKRRKPKEEANGSSRSRHAFFSSLLLSPLLNPNLRNSPTPNSPPQQRPLPLRAHPGPRRRAPLPGRARNLRRGGRPCGQDHRCARVESRYEDQCRFSFFFEQRRRRKLYFSASPDGERPSIPPRGSLHRHDNGRFYIRP